MVVAGVVRRAFLRSATHTQLANVNPTARAMNTSIFSAWFDRGLRGEPQVSGRTNERTNPGKKDKAPTASALGLAAIRKDRPVKAYLVRFKPTENALIAKPHMNALPTMARETETEGLPKSPSAITAYSKATILAMRDNAPNTPDATRCRNS